MLINSDSSDKGSDSEPEISDGDGIEEEPNDFEEEEDEEEEVIDDDGGGEEEEEEEEEVEEVDDEERIADSSSDSPSAPDNDENDSSQEVESEGDEDLRLVKSKETLASAAHGTENRGGQCDSLNTSNEPLEVQVKELPHISDGDSKPQISAKDLVSSEEDMFPESFPNNKGIGLQTGKSTPIEACISVQKDYAEAHCGNQDHLNNSISTGADKTKSSVFDEKEVAGEILMGDGSADKVAKIVLCSEEETKKMDMQSGEDVKLKAPSLITPQIRPRSLSPDAEFEDGNKRSAIICDFFARGWCIKGSSCKFLHRKDGVDSPMKCTEHEVLIANSKDKFEEDAGLRVEAKKSSLLYDPLAASVSNDSSSKSSFPSDRILVGEHGDSQRSQQSLDKKDRHDSPVVRGDLPKFVSPASGWPPNPSSEMQWKSSPGEEYNRSPGMPLLHDNFMGNKRSTSEEYVRGFPSSRNYLGPEHRFLSSGSITSSSIYGNSSSSFAYEKGISPLHHAYAWSGTASSIGSSPLGIMKPLDGDQGYYASRSSLLRGSSSPLYSRPEQDNLSLHSISGDPFASIGHSTQSTVNNWEPSIPFRTSFHFPSIFSSPRSQYDPLIDSIEPPNGGDSLFRSSSISQGATIHNTSNQQANGDSVSFHRQPQYTVPEKNMSTYGIGAHEISAEATGTFVAEQQNKSSVFKEQQPSKHGHVVNISNAKEVDLDRSQQADGGKNNKESKTLKLFRASLVDFVKELVKPYWREGHLSKDAHNMIVKKAVEKVLSALQHQQVPSTTELTNQYLSSSRPKLAKLVEGYVGKYSKS